MIIDVTGHNHYEDLLDFVERNYKKKQSGSSESSKMEALAEAAFNTPEYRAYRAAQLQEKAPNVFDLLKKKGSL